MLPILSLDVIYLCSYYDSVLFRPHRKPPLNRSNLPQMRLSDKIRLRRNILNTVTIPMMAGARNQIARVDITADARARRKVRVVAQIEPDIRVAVDESQARGGDVPAAVLVVLLEVGSRRETVVFAGWECPGTPLLSVGIL
jgi:hypothetical protein